MKAHVRGMQRPGAVAAHLEYDAEVDVGAGKLQVGREAAVRLELCVAIEARKERVELRPDGVAVRQIISARERGLQCAGGVLGFHAVDCPRAAGLG